MPEAWFCPYRTSGSATREYSRKERKLTMNILVICQYYYPEPFRISDICEGMVKRGHSVTVITGEPNYPEGFIYKGYENHSRTDEIINGVTIHRCPIIPRKTGVLYRFLNYFSYPYKAKKYIKNLMTSENKPFDVVFVNQLSPVMMAEPGITYGKKYRIPIVMYCLDIWPESLVAGGIRRSSPIYGLFHRISKRIYKSVDKILITSKLFRGYLEEQFAIDDKVIKYLPQYAEGLFEPLAPKGETGFTDLVFAGNIGEVQSIDTIIKAADKLKNEKIRFHIVGGGTDLGRLKRTAEHMKNVTFYGRRPLEEMPYFYSLADAMLVTLKADPILSLTLPGKVQSYMAVGKPIIGAIDGETSGVIKEAQCGFCGKADDAEELANNIMKFVADKNKEIYGYNARKYYDKYFDRSIFMDKLEKELATIG